MKIFHISDLHFGMQHGHLMQPFLKDLKESAPEVIIISGDVTHRATKQQYQHLATFLKKIPARILIVPGNHDIPLHDVISRLFFPFDHYKRFISPSLSAEFINNEVRILGVNSVNPYRIKDGKLSSKTLHDIQHYFSPAFEGVNILFFHHNFDYIEGLHKPLENYQRFLSFLKESTVDMVCTGHSHYGDLTLIEKNDEKSCLILHAGTLFCARSKDHLNSYYQIEVSNKKCTIDWRVFNQTSFNTVTTNEIDFTENFSTNTKAF